MDTHNEPPAEPWGTPVERERRRRISVCVGAYAYEIMDDPVMPDSIWDWLAGKIDRHMDTGHPELDAFFRTEFSPMTAMWIRAHPELDGIKRIHDRYRREVHDYFQSKVGPR